MNTMVKTKPLARVSAEEAISQHGVTEAMRSAAYDLDIRLIELRQEFQTREAKLRQDFLDQISEITA